MASGTQSAGDAGTQGGRVPGPLGGYRIIDLTTVFLGPFGTQILGDLGADVIKVEEPAGDIVRHVAPYRNPGMGHVFLSGNRNKRSVVLDLKKPAGVAAMRRLLAGADAFLTSVRPAALARLGFDYESCRATNPRLVYVAIVGFGQDGPYAARPAYDDIIQGVSGMAAMQGGRDDPPRFINSSITDKILSQVVAWSAMAGLLHRERSGEGQHIEVPMLETMLGFNLMEHAAGHIFDPPLGPMGYERAMVEHRRPYATVDGYVCILPYSLRQWRAFFGVIGREDLGNDERVTDARIRSEKIGELYEIVAAAVRDWKTVDLLAALEAADVPHGRVNQFEDLAEDPHLKVVGAFRHFDHPSEGPIRLTGIPVKFSATPADIRRMPARLGEHSVEVLGGVGLTEDEIDAMIRDGATVDGNDGNDGNDGGDGGDGGNSGSSSGSGSGSGA